MKGAISKPTAPRLGISLLWVPTGATGICSFLDCRVFRAFKAKERANGEDSISNTPIFAGRDFDEMD
jgi:hypothetical protein